MSKAGLADSKSGKGKKPALLIGAAVIILTAVVAGIWFSGILSHFGSHGVKSTAAIAEKPTLVDLPDIVSNLDTGSHRASFIKLHAKLQVAHATDALALQAAVPQILDIFQTYLRSTRPDELRGGEGTYRLREALMNRIDVTVAPVEVTDLLFTELLVQ